MCYSRNWRLSGGCIGLLTCAPSLGSILQETKGYGVPARPNIAKIKGRRSTRDARGYRGWSTGTKAMMTFSVVNCTTFMWKGIFQRSRAFSTRSIQNLP